MSGVWHQDGRDLVVLVPMLGRPHTVEPLLESIRASVPAAGVLWCLSTGDREVVAAVRAVDGNMIEIPFAAVGDYARKINRGVVATTQPLIFCGACDLRFHPGWYEAATAHLVEGVGLVGTNDLGSARVMAGEHATHCLMTREYALLGAVDTPGKPLAEVYPHEYVDDEQVETAKWRGAWAMALDSHVEHLHPNWGKARMDGTYLGQRARMIRGKPIYLRRRHLWGN